jgi:energy-coupling factor transporter ATP-binding protein EcfA2
MRRRLDIAMSLVGNPPVIFLDEPTTGLDPEGRLEVWQAIRELAGQGTTVLLTTQYLDEAEQLADRIAILHEGRIIALILADPANVTSPFFLPVPEWGRLPMVLLATAATVIASQAVITGAFSVASQAAQLGYLHRLRIAHTSETERGQIYVPWINWLLLVSVLTLVFAFRTSAPLAFAFGMAVTGTIIARPVLYRSVGT